MSAKICTKCHIEKPIEEFYPSKGGRSRRSQCIPCKNAVRRQEYASNRERECEAAKRWKQDHSEMYQEWAKEYTKEPKIRERRNALRRERRRAQKAKEPPCKTENCVIRKLLSGRIWAALKGITKSARTFDLLGCSIEDFKRHLESKFLPNMTWDNRGKGTVSGPPTWHIDHIKPCAAFDLTDPEQQRACFHYTNCQPLWWRENLEKNDKIEIDGKLVRASSLRV